MNASALPDPKEISYDVLLRCVQVLFDYLPKLFIHTHVVSRIFAYLNLYGMLIKLTANTP
jgi:hypothetical protein